MKYPILNFSNTDFDSFVKQWSALYNYDNMYLYTNNIDKELLDEKDLIELYEWKNGMPLSIKKAISLKENILDKIGTVNNLKKEF